MQNKPSNKFKVLLAVGGAVILGLAVWLIVILLPERGIVGTWKITSGEGWQYEFYDDGTGKFGMADVENKMGFDYTITDDTLKFRYERADVDTEVKYKIEDGKLIFQSDSEENVEYSRK